MTRKHFELIASTIRNAALPTETADAIRYEMAREFASRLASENPRFDAYRFIAACTA